MRNGLHLGVMFAMLTGVFTAAMGDVGPRPRPHPIPPRPPELFQVAMQSAQVAVQLRAAETGDSSANKPPTVIADVVAEFDMQCLSAPGGRTEYDMAFPVRCDQDGPSRVTSIAVTVDGQELPRTQVQPMQNWQPGPLQTPRASFDGFHWPATAVNGQKQHIKVAYSLELPLQNNTAAFRYILRTGSLWAGPIGVETVCVKAAAGLQINPLPTPNFKPAQERDGSMTWKIENAKPTDDVLVQVTK